MPTVRPEVAVASIASANKKRKRESCKGKACAEVCVARVGRIVRSIHLAVDDHLSHNQTPVLKWVTQNHVRKYEGGHNYLRLGLSLANPLPGFVLWLTSARLRVSFRAQTPTPPTPPPPS